MVLFAMIYGTVPFKAKNMSELNDLISNAKYTLKPCASEEVRDLLKMMLEVDSSKRITIPEIFKHKWFASYDPNVELLNEIGRESCRERV